MVSDDLASIVDTVSDTEDVASEEVSGKPAAFGSTDASDPLRDGTVRLAQTIRPTQPQSSGSLPQTSAPPQSGVSQPGAPQPGGSQQTGAPGATASTPGSSLGIGPIGPSASTNRIGIGYIGSQQAKFTAATDLGNLVGKFTGQENRNPIITAPKLNANDRGRLVSAGSYWFPARPDLDTALSKIDSRIVEGTTVIKGPYSSRFGPGFNFIHFDLMPAPRFPNGPESHGSSSLEYKTNGEQWYGRQSVWSGAGDWGVRIGYGHRTGSDYETGAGFELPSSYNSRNPDVAIGLNLTENSRLDFHYLRLDQTNLEFPGQFYDINYLGTDGYELNYVLENQELFDRLAIEGWYNRTRFHGDTSNPGKRRRLSFLNEFDVNSQTDVSASSAGYSLAVSWGDPDSAEFTVGSDLRFLKQRLKEETFIGGASQPDALIPPADSSNPGLFLDGTLQVTDRLTLYSGARVDWVSTDARSDFDLGDGQPVELSEVLGAIEGFHREFDLWAAYLTAEYEVNSQWTALGGFGHAIRPPTMVELYAFNPFVAALPQLVLTSVRGNPNLSLPRAWQVDVGLKGERGRFRGGINGFHAWINNYITLESGVATGPVDGTVLFGYVNTELATLAGGEAFGEFDVNQSLTAFAKASYVEGRDQTRANNIHPNSGANDRDERSSSLLQEEPLPAIPPFEASLGLRVDDGSQNPVWVIEFLARVVDNQDRIAETLREVETPGFTIYSVRGYWQAFDDLLLTAGVENLTDKFYRTHFDTVRFAEVFKPGVNFYFGSELTY